MHIRPLLLALLAAVLPAVRRKREVVFEEEEV